VNALDLIMLGRRLTKIGEQAMRGSDALTMPTGARLVISDVFAHPDSSIREITARTGLQQSHVSVAVAELRKQEILETEIDPADRRRTVVRVSGAHPRRVVAAGAVSVDRALAAELHEHDRHALGAIVDQLDELARRLQPENSGPIARDLEAAR
jgi:DNA-binding MarR family transcriptional regulator